MSVCFTFLDDVLSTFISIKFIYFFFFCYLCFLSLIRPQTLILICMLIRIDKNKETKWGVTFRIKFLTIKKSHIKIHIHNKGLTNQYNRDLPAPRTTSTLTGEKHKALKEHSNNLHVHCTKCKHYKGFIHDIENHFQAVPQKSHSPHKWKHPPAKQFQSSRVLR